VPRRFPAMASARGRGNILVMILLAVIAGACTWCYFAPGSMPGWLARTLPASPSLGPPMYKWRDEKGRLHVTDRPPADRPYETLRYDPNTNVVPGSKPP
jgi:hypothetical protein